MSAADGMEWAGSALIVIGLLFCAIGAIGMLRLPDVYARLHGAGIVDTMGAGAVLLGLALHAGFGLVAVKLLMIFVVLLFTCPTASHALARAALSAGVRPDAEIRDVDLEGDS